MFWWLKSHNQTENIIVTIVILFPAEKPGVYEQHLFIVHSALHTSRTCGPSRVKKHGSSGGTRAKLSRTDPVIPHCKSKAKDLLPYCNSNVSTSHFDSLLQMQLTLLSWSQCSRNGITQTKWCQPNNKLTLIGNMPSHWKASCGAQNLPTYNHHHLPHFFHNKHCQWGLGLEQTFHPSAKELLRQPGENEI